MSEKEHPIWRVVVRRTNGYFVWHYKGTLRNVLRIAKRQDDTIIEVVRESDK